MFNLKFKVSNINGNFSFLKQTWENNYHSARDGFFLSPDWIFKWLSRLPPEYSPQLLMLNDDRVTYFSTTIGQSTKRLLFLDFQIAWFNETGLLDYDDIVLENNGFVGAVTNEKDLSTWNNLLLELGVDQLRINNISEKRLRELNRLFTMDGCRATVSSRPSYYVCLETVRSHENDYLSLLSANKRRQIKRSYKYYQSIELIEPEDSSEALIMFDEMVELHQKEWKQRGKPGAFSNQFIYQVHKSLIQDTFDRGKVKIYRFKAAEQTIGIIYGFLNEGDFSYYQSGFMYSSDNKVKPGLNCHAVLIEFMASKGYKRYDFLAGEAEYKKSLGTGFYNMCHFEVYNNTFKNSLYLMFRKLRRAFIHRLGLRKRNNA